MTDTVVFFDPAIGRNACAHWDGERWTMERYDPEAKRWCGDGELTEKGRRGIIDVLKLGEFGESLPLDAMRGVAPHKLRQGMRRFRAAKGAAVLSFVLRD